MRRFELVDGKSSKFWEVDVDDETLVVRYGRIGTNGQSKEKDLGSPEKADAEREKLIRQKLGKGYSEVGADTATSASASAPAPAPAPAPAEVTAKKKSARKKAAAKPKTTPIADAGLPRVHLSDAARERIAPRTADEVPAPGKAPTWKALRKLLLAEIGDLSEWRQGLGATVPTLKAGVRAAIAWIDADAPAPLEPEVAALVLAMCFPFDPSSTGAPRTTERLVELWCDEHGEAFATESVIRTLAFQTAQDHSDSAWIVRTEPVHLPVMTGGGKASEWGEPCGVGAFRALRRRLLTAAPDVRATARVLAAAAREGASLPVRCATSFLFPAEGWADDDLEACAAALEPDPLFWGPNPTDILPRCTLSLLPSLEPTDRLVQLLEERTSDHQLCSSPWELLGCLGPRAAPFLLKIATSEHLAIGGRRPAAEALEQIESEEAARMFAGLLGDRSLKKNAAAYFQRSPALAFVALPGVKGKAAREAKTLLEGLARAHPELAAESPAVAAAAPAAPAPAAPEAPADALPPVLASPPWTRAKRAKPTVVRGIEPLPLAADRERVVWWDREPPRPYYHDRPPKAANTKRDAEWLRDLEKERAKNGGEWIWWLDRLSDAAATKAWNETPPTFWFVDFDSSPLNFFARVGIAGLPGLLALAERKPAISAETLAHVDSPRVAPLLAKVLATSKTARPVARSWLKQFPETAAEGLIPDAVGKAGKARAAAEAALRFLDRAGHGDAVRAAAWRFADAKVGAVVDEILSVDPLEAAVPKKIPKLPSFVDLDRLPRPLLRESGAALPASALEALVTMLAISTLEEPYAGLDEVRAAVTPASLEELAWVLFQEWQLAGAPSKQAWAFEALGILGGDEAARRLTPLIRAWPGEGGSARAASGLSVLAAIGTDVALMHLHGIGLKIKYAALQRKAREKIDEIAEARGLSSAELADRLVPDLDLDERGTRILDLGPRAFTVGFDEQLKPFVIDGDGARKKDLPKPAKSDDAAKAETATKAWKALKKDAKKVAQGQILRLELAMVDRRRWDMPTFRRFLVEHPLMIHLVRLIVWGRFGDGGELASTFRVAEDRTFADVGDEVLSLGDDAIIGIPHRLDLDDALAARWQELLADYEIVPPFPQLGRETHRPSKKELGANTIDRLAGITVGPGRLLRLQDRGWKRVDQDVESGVATRFARPLPRGAGGEEQWALLEIEPGIYLADPSLNEEQTIARVQLRRGDVLRSWDTEPVKSKDADPIGWSEAMSDIEGMSR